MSASEKPPAEYVRRVLSPRQLRLHNPRFGAHGELRAAAYLRRKGYDVLMRNVRVGRGEIDIVALDRSRKELVFVEVKTRSSERLGSAAESVGWKKLSVLRKAAQALLAQSAFSQFHFQAYRFDIIAVVPGTIHHYQNVTW